MTMLKIDAVTQCVALVCIVVLAVQVAASPSTVVFRPLRSAERPRICSRNTPCLWALCVWSQDVSATKDNCMFIPSGCKCQRGQRCRRTVEMTPDNGYLTIPFTCQ
ncbi:unnamed protein product [Lymnaea stagnalis]|uniref:Uncharacterized protein n=1 Tax=Lymnaea stagnalis TaxID=6523 RepID=A0AAV2H9S0_LYMST